jgi:predicted Zn-dependent protease
MKRRFISVVAMFAVGLAAGTVIVSANHSWNCRGPRNPYHWGSRTVSHGNPVQDGSIVRSASSYSGALNGAITTWNNQTVMSLTNGSQQELRYGAYGSNGWLGLATISQINNCVIGHSKSQLNDSYLRDTSRYNQTAVDHVACQEVGHTYGLDHQRNATNSCMNDSILTAGNQINQHDVDMIAQIYANIP